MSPVFVSLVALLSVIVSCAGSQIMDVIGVVETDSIFKQYSGQYKPSQNHLNPTPIDDSLAYMVAPRRFVLQGQATSKLTVKLLVGDTLRWFGSSESDNFDSAVIVYEAKHDSELFEKTKLTHLQNSPCAQPDDLDIRKIKQKSCSHIVIQAQTLKAGQAHYELRFGLYTKDYKTNKQVLFGYFKWTPELVVPIVN